MGKEVAKERLKAYHSKNSPTIFQQILLQFHYSLRLIVRFIASIEQSLEFCESFLNSENLVSRKGLNIKPYPSVSLKPY